MKRTAAAVPSAGAALEAFDRLVKVSDKKEFQTRCFIVDVAHGPMMMWLCKDDYLPIQAQDGQLGNESKRGCGWVLFVLFWILSTRITSSSTGASLARTCALRP